MIAKFLPEKVEPAINKTILYIKDALDTLLQRRPPLVPPRRMMFDGPQDPALFIANGEEFLRYYVELCSLKPNARILDVGSGIGRKTLPLTGYLDETGRYVGLDINKRGIAWCRRHISTKHPNFTFQEIDVFNGRYNPKGTQKAEEYTFPIADGSIDFVTMGSVFTHMFPAGVERYLAESARVLDQGGRSFISYFLLNHEAEAGIVAGNSAFRFPFRIGEHAIERESRPEDAVAFDEAYVRRLYANLGLEIEEIFYGSWSGRSDFLSHQDLILARKV